MSCPICHRSSCIKSFHSLESQERFNKKQNLSDDVDELREAVLDLYETIDSLKAENTELKLELTGKHKYD